MAENPLTVRILINLSIGQSVNLSICQSVNLLFVYLSIYGSVILSVFKILVVFKPKIFKTKITSTNKFF